MGYVDVAARTTYVGAQGPDAPAIYVIDLPYHPFDIDEVSRGRAASVVRLPVLDWDDSLTPWVAPGLYAGDADFGGRADGTLAELLHEAIPAVERADGLSPARRAVCGYSLGGLFALYAFVRGDDFAACGCLSGSVWYEGWVGWLRKQAFDGAGRYAFLSIGSREKNAREAILHHVQDDMAACADILRSRGCAVDYRVGPGSHLDHQQERFDAGIAALDTFLAR